MLWGTESLVVKDMFETKTFFLKSVVKGSCTLVEFRVSLEKKRTDGKVFIYEKYNSRDSAADSALTIKEKPCNGRARLRLSGRSLFLLGLMLKDVLLGLIASSALL